MSATPRTTPVLVAAAAGSVLGALALSLWVASREWFTRDDFAFLAAVQMPEGWSWEAVYLPLGERFWPFYRPLSMETYFWAGYRLFGLDAFGYFAFSLALHFASSILVYRLARRFGMGAPVALASAALAVTRWPSLHEIYWGSVVMYVATSALSLLAADRFLARLAGGGATSQLASCAALLAALLCNEIAVSIPAVLALAALAEGSVRGGARDLARLARALAPHLAITAAYLGFRFGFLAPARTSELYTPSLGAHVGPNAAALLGDLAGSAPTALGFGSAALVALGIALAGRARAPGALAWLARVGGACLAWAACLLLPFALLPFPQPRWAMNLEVPLCLAFGALLEAARRSFPAARQAAFDAALAAFLVAVVPWSALVARGLDPQGAHPRQLVEAIDSARPPLSDTAQLVLLFDAPGLASSEQAELVRSLAYGGGVLNAVDPRTGRVLRFQDLSRRPGRNAVRPDSVYLALLPDLRVVRADPALVARELPRGVE